MYFMTEERWPYLNNYQNENENLISYRSDNLSVNDFTAGSGTIA